MCFITTETDSVSSLKGVQRERKVLHILPRKSRWSGGLWEGGWHCNPRTAECHIWAFSIMGQSRNETGDYLI